MNAGPIHDAVVLGGGPAGLLAARVLGATGRSVLCLDDRFGRASPQSQHVHHFRGDTWARLAASWPDIDEHLEAAGVLFTDADGRYCPASRTHATPQPDRAVLDSLLPQLESPGVGRYAERALHAHWRNGAWTIETQDATTHRARWLIDATGRARKSLGWIAAIRHRPAAVDEAPTPNLYYSALFEAPDLAPERVLLRERQACGAGLLGLRLSERRWRITLVSAAARHAATGDDTLARAPETFRKPLLTARRLSCWRRHGAPPASLLAMDEIQGVPGWFALGDGLLTTAPYQGNGYAQLLDQVEALALGLQGDESADQLRLRLFRVARRAWFRSTLADGFSTAATDPCGLKPGQALRPAPAPAKNP